MESQKKTELSEVLRKIGKIDRNWSFFIRKDRTAYVTLFYFEGEEIHNISHDILAEVRWDDESENVVLELAALKRPDGLPKKMGTKFIFEEFLEYIATVDGPWALKYNEFCSEIELWVKRMPAETLKGFTPKFTVKKGHHHEMGKCIKLIFEW